MKIRLDTSTLFSQHKSGVASYTQLLKTALSHNPNITFTAIDAPLLPLKPYAKLQSYNTAPPFDLFLSKVDLTIFPNFATWPTVKSRFTAAVIHDLTYLYFPELVERKNLAHLKRVVPRSIQKADFIITVSESVKAELVKEFNLAEDKCIVTPIPPDEAFYRAVPKDEIATVREKYGISNSKQYIYFIGNLEPRKNLKALIEAYCLLPDEIKKEYSLILAGAKGWKSEETQKTLDAAIAKGEDIKHIGFVDQLDSPALYQGASLFVMPSLYEGFGIPVLESMASGTPVVAADIPVLREVGGASAAYADPKNPAVMANVIEDTLVYKRPTRTALQKHVRQYSWGENIEKIINKVRSLE